MDSKAVVKPAIVLLLISAIAAGILGVVSEVTAAPIAAQNEKSLNEGMHHPRVRRRDLRGNSGLPGEGLQGRADRAV